MAGKNLDALFFDTLRDIYYAENHIVKTLPKLEKTAVSDELKEAFATHTKETDEQIKRLQKVFELLDRKPTSKRCEAIDGILSEGDEIIGSFAGSAVLDDGLISSAQAVEHYEIARYTALGRWAKALGLSDAVTLLGETLDEEVRTDKLLNKIADVELKAKAAKKP
ncbi:Ferritin-like metal-binding protein YciE [Propionibacterium cyclohexanicum]|uniref:Ferritin-like metal-binding protein YciE n=1 Tax=Propionibacterium cyclohexanicum TaxID=64702 RepID=A0A1H9U2Q7_9ACTN|nr:ferritin-like domain-containing protein [Propionibacterium cyclohexanicum]SES03528.1 Ferritin-like metal-binding protein YciE [Propionibacterium cyclohexanicum]